MSGKTHEEHTHLHPEAQLYAHHAEALLAHAEASKQTSVEQDKKEEASEKK